MKSAANWAESRGSREGEKKRALTDNTSELERGAADVLREKMQSDTAEVLHMGGRAGRVPLEGKLLKASAEAPPGTFAMKRNALLPPLTPELKRRLRQMFNRGLLGHAKTTAEDAYATLNKREAGYVDRAGLSLVRIKSHFSALKRRMVAGDEEAEADDEEGEPETAGAEEIESGDGIEREVAEIEEALDGEAEEDEGEVGGEDDDE